MSCMIVMTIFEPRRDHLFLNRTDRCLANTTDLAPDKKIYPESMVE